MQFYILKRNVFAAGWMTFFLLAMGACGQQEGHIQVTFSVFGDPAEFSAYRSLVEAFHQNQPEVRIELQHIPSQAEYRQRLATQFSAGSPPDVFLLNYRRFAAFAGEGGLEPLGPYLARSRLLEEEAFFPQALAVFRFQDQLWCIPQNISSLVVFYNRDMFDAAGLAYPRPGWDREEFLQAGRLLTRDVDGDGTIDQYGAGLSPNLFRLAPFIWQDGGELVDDAENPTRLMLDEAPALDTFRWFAGLQVEENIVPDAVAEAVISGENRFMAGSLGMYFNSRRGVPGYRTITGFDWDVAPLPVGNQAVGILHSDAYCLAAGAENKDAAWAFIEFANAFEGQEIVVESGRTVPSLVDVANSPAFLNPGLPPANSEVWVETVPLLRSVPVMAGWVGVEELAGKEIERAFYGQATVEEAAQRAVEQTRLFFQSSK